MDTQDDTSVLRSKLRRRPSSGSDAARPLIRALRLAIARVSREHLGLGMDVIGGTEATLPPEGLEPMLGSEHMLVFLEAPGKSAGALAIGVNLVRALVQLQTTGALAQAESDPRAFTNTDTALCTPVIDRVLEAADGVLSNQDDRGMIEGYRLGSRAEDPRSMVVALDGDRFRAIEVTVDIGGAVQSGLTLVLPDRDAAHDPAAEKMKAHALTLADAACGAAVRLNAVMCRIPLSLGHLSNLAIGEVLALPAYRLDRTALLTTSGQPTGVGRLGQVDGLRAVRVNETSVPPQAFVEPQPADHGLIDTVRVEDPQGGTGSNEPPLELMDQETALKHISQLAGLDQDETSSAEPDMADP